MTMTRRRLGIGVVGFGWMGQAHSPSAARIASLFPERDFDTDLVVCGDNVPVPTSAGGRRLRVRRGRRRLARRRRAPRRRRRLCHRSEHDARAVAVAAAQAGKAVFCEKPVGGTPEQTVRIAAAANRAGVVTGVGYNYRWAPLVQSRQAPDRLRRSWVRSRTTAVASSRCTAPTRWVCCRGGSCVDDAGHGVSSDILSHSVDLATMLIGPIDSVTGTMETSINERPLAKAGRHALRPSASRATRPARSPTRTTPARWCGSPTVLSGVRGVASDHRPRVADGLRRLRHQGRSALEPRDDERAARCSSSMTRGRHRAATPRSTAAIVTPTTGLRAG